MIRERGKCSYVAASWVWHVALLLLAAVPSGRSPYLIAMTVLLLARAVALPVVTRRTTLKPVVTGITERLPALLLLAALLRRFSDASAIPWGGTCWLRERHICKGARPL